MLKFINTTGFPIYILSDKSEYFKDKDILKIKDSDIIEVPSSGKGIFPITRSRFFLKDKVQFILYDDIILPDPIPDVHIIVSEYLKIFCVDRPDVLYISSNDSIYFKHEWIFTKLTRVCSRKN